MPAVSNPPATASGGSNESHVFEHHHEDLVHDAQFDYYGRRLATCSSDRTVRLWQLDGAGHESFLTSLSGHEGPVWQVAWAHPRFGSILASASFDGRVLVWKEDRAARSKWTRVHEHAVHEASVNAIAWAPHEAGLVLACASSDGKVSLVEADVQTGQWHTRACFAAHQMGVMAVSFAADASKDGTASLRFATGGCDNLVKLWTLPPRNPDDAAPVTKVEPEQVLTGHQDWVRDVAWAPHDPLLLASASADRTVLLWRPRSPPSPSSRSPSTPATSATRNGSCEWSSSPLSPSPFPDTVWRISWSDSGHLLAASCGDNQVTLWSSPSDAAKQPGQPWECVSTLPQTD